MSSVTAILVSYNSEAVIGSALHALSGMEVIVVDNCSSDDTCELIARDFPHVRIIENPRNEGFGRANNRALEQVQTNFALLVNPDAVLQEGALEALLEAAARYPDAAILAPQLLDEKGEMVLSYKRDVFARERLRFRDGEVGGDLCAEYLSGAVWLLNMQHMRQVGFFDPAIFLYYEDDDVCIRTRKAGFSLVLVHDAKAVHLQGASSGVLSEQAEFFKQKQMIWSRLYIQRKYRGPVSARLLSCKLQFEYSAKAAYYALTMNARKLARYRGRITGIVAFNEDATKAPR